MLASWIVPVIVTLGVFLFISLFILLWTLLRSSHKFTPKPKSFSENEKAVRDFHSNISMNFNKAPSKQHIPPPTYVPPQPYCSLHHQNHAFQHAENSHFCHQHENQQVHHCHCHIDENQQQNNEQCCHKCAN
ncbi:hypothetical protein RS030_142135 [Cryptosporidium xiaoi]|uniref:Uncharacterized protein n=1 Tax=Cryptosporidium xiaoi TaxID=659607 RepID=A0AAV9Y0X5_9CRYT